MKDHKIIAAIGAIILVGGGYFWHSKSHSNTTKAQYITQAAEKTTISVAVPASGQVSAESQIDLKPGSAGALVQVSAKAGDEVKSGQVIAVVDQSSNNVVQAQARATLMKAQADYDKLIAGLTGSDLTAVQKTVNDAQTLLDKAATDLNKAQRDYNTAVSEQQQAVERANTKLLNSGLEALPNNSLNTMTATVSGTYTGSKEDSYIISFYETGNGTYYQVSGLSGHSNHFEMGLNLPVGNGLYVNFTSSGTFYEHATFYTIDVPNKTSSDYQTNLNAYNDALLEQKKALQSAQDQIDSSNVALKNAQDNLKNAQIAFDAKIAPPKTADVTTAKAAILSAQAQLESTQNNYNNNILKSPFDGIVAAINNKKADQVTSATVVATVITKKQLATVSLNEVDAAKVTVGQKATLTFDALEDLSLTGQAVEIGTLGAVTQGVVSYVVKIGFDTQDQRVKPGMSVSANIITQVKTDVLAVPSSAVKTNSGGKYVQMLDALDQPQNKNVEVGISNDSMTEITSGLNLGDEVVTQTITSPTQSTNRNTTTGIPGLGGNVRLNGGFGGGGVGGNRTFNNNAR